MIYIDVRTKEEYEGGHIKGAIHHDIMDIMQGVFPEFPKDTEMTLYCESGNRSMMAKSLLEKAGFTHVINGGSMSDVLL
ncbi:MAG: phage shock protein [Patescibacteria group bacterium]|nr:phage shock protein [Patescibacteria group bacterium]